MRQADFTKDAPRERYADMTLRCLGCNEEFIWQATEQIFFADRGLQQPKRCLRCRAMRRAERSTEHL
jgi:hypothetical protein